MRLLLLAEAGLVEDDVEDILGGGLLWFPRSGVGTKMVRSSVLALERGFLVPTWRVGPLVYRSLGLLRSSAFTLWFLGGCTLERACFVTTPERGNDGAVWGLVALGVLEWGIGRYRWTQLSVRTPQ